AGKRFDRMAARPSKTQDSTVTEYLYTYHHWISDYDNSEHREWATHRIIRKTAKRIFIFDVHSERFLIPEKLAEHPEDFTTISLDRQKLDHDGKVYSRGRGSGCECYYNEQGKARFDAECLHRPVPPCLAALGLSHGCTEKEIKRAF